MNLHTLSAAAAFAALLFCPRPAASQDQQVFPDPMVTFHAERQSLRSILELMAEEAKLKIDFTDRALKVANQGTVSASLENVPFSRALASIVRDRDESSISAASCSMGASAAAACGPRVERRRFVSSRFATTQRRSSTPRSPLRDSTRRRMPQALAG